ncbi:hypothetical protein MWN33_17905 [Starkeya koreensis]|uniref:Uncharacterized protein n=1 Tax=Ancylobacter koreensis TaxID=266121 RepID=A0ABT0DRK9_9HYPH|nr:hypothetical protein [Ancylobacter koreensis]MCK0209909.1 hypothetical protein [Ancylobacter koreensis]
MFAARSMLAAASLVAASLAVLVATPALAKDRNVDIVNESGFTITSFYASAVDEDTWEEDMLDNDTLKDGETLEAEIDDGTDACIYDFKAVFSDGDVAIKRKVNVCEIGTFTFKP